MVVNHERFPPAGEPPADWRGGFGVYDVSDPSKPKQITRWETSGTGCHRYDLQGNLLFTSATLDGYVGTIVMIFDLKDPAKPQEVGRWHMPGQWTAGGETPTWKGTAHRCHHPLRQGNRLYVSYWQGGFVILDIAICRSRNSSPASTGRRHSRARPIARCRSRSRSPAARS